MNECMDNWIDWQHHLNHYFTFHYTLTMLDNLSTTLQLLVPAEGILKHHSRHLQKALQDLKDISSLT